MGAGSAFPTLRSAEARAEAEHQFLASLSNASQKDEVVEGYIKSGFDSAIVIGILNDESETQTFIKTWLRKKSVDHTFVDLETWKAWLKEEVRDDSIEAATSLLEIFEAYRLAKISQSNKTPDRGRVSSQIADALVEQVSWARTHPQDDITVLRERLPRYKGKELSPATGQSSVTIVTKEGAAAVKDALRFLASQAPIGGVGAVSEEGLELAAADHAADIGATGAASHASSDGTSPADRARRLPPLPNPTQPKLHTQR